MRATATAATITDLSALSVILTIREVAALYRVSEATIRRGVQNGTFSPRPWDRYPWRWRREDVLADLQKQKGEGPARKHGFAVTGQPARRRRAARATLPTPVPTRSNGTK